MDIVDLILNLAGLLLWLSWRAGRIAQAPLLIGVTLASTLQPLQRRKESHWRPLIGLGVLLVVRSFFYRQIGSAVHWLPALDLYAIRLPFRSDTMQLMAAYSLLSFLFFLGKFYTWLLVLSALTRRMDSDSVTKHLRAQLGMLASWPVAVRLLIPSVAMMIAWAVLHYPLAALGIIPREGSAGLVAQQAMTLGLAMIMSWEFMLVGLLLLYVINDYVYLGNHPWWLFVQVVGKRLLRPLDFFPLKIARFDLAPFVMLAVILIGGELARSELPLLYARLPF